MSKCKNPHQGTTGDHIRLPGSLHTTTGTTNDDKLAAQIDSRCPCLVRACCHTSQVLTSHYEPYGRYYGSVGGYQGSASEEEKRLTMMLFSGIFDSLAQRALPCLSAIGIALSPDYSLGHHDDS